MKAEITSASQQATKKRWNWKFLVRYGLFLLLVGELGARAFLAATAGVSMLRPGDLVSDYYPYPPFDRSQAALFCDLKSIREAAPTKEDGYIDVLLLGGSVIDRRWTDIDAVLSQRLSDRLRRPVRTHNLAAQAHTSRDSFFKYRRLQDVPFDLVVVYHGINDTRLNHCPTDVFRADYSHLRWYDQVNRIEAHREIGLIALPYVAGGTCAAFADWLSGANRRAEQMETSPPEAWLEFGRNVKTSLSFRSNLTAILELARAKHEQVVLMSFASYVAPGYSKERFQKKQLDYDRHQTPIEVWGTPEGVAAGIRKHNQITQQLARRFDNTLFVDQAAKMPSGAEYYQDICHLTHRGAKVFVEHLLEAVIPALQRRNDPVIDEAS